MKILWLFLFLHSALAQVDFGTSYLKNSKLCQQWNCINSKLGLPQTLPPKDQYASVLKSILPAGDWHTTVDKALDVCYGDRPRRYTNTCPGQAVMHCAFDQLIQYCPEESSRKNDACAPISSLAGFKYMFSQSRYDNLEKNLPTEVRPSWFLKNYFSSKCCDVPALFNSTVMAECGFTTIIHYHTHEPRPNIFTIDKLPKQAPKTTADPDRVKVVDISVNNIDASPRPMNENEDTIKVQSLDNIDYDTNLDPLECCDMESLIQPSWRSDCDFHLTWAGQDRLSIQNSTRLTTTTPPPTTTAPVARHDVKIVPVSCKEETCVFKKLNIISESGTIDMDAFSKLLDNLTSAHNSWTKAKARVVTKCLSKPIMDYSEDCEINKVLACTFDVLSENCPHAKKADPCKHSNLLTKDVTCQISSSKLRPKNRRQFCGLPNLVNHEVLSECGINSLSRMEYVPDPPAKNPRKYTWWSHKYVCKELTPSTKCLLTKMGVLNKYSFMDYFKMKERIRHFTEDNARSALTDIYVSAFNAVPLYREQCSSPKKLLNIVDAMLMTCPMSKRKQTPQCNRLFSEIANTPPVNINQRNLDQIWRHFNHVFLPHGQVVPPTSTTPRIHRNPAYDFGILHSKNIPPISTIDLKRKVTEKPLVLLPVYMRMTGIGKGSVSIGPYHDSVLRSDPFALHNKIAMAHTTQPNLS